MYWSVKSKHSALIVIPTYSVDMELLPWAISELRHICGENKHTQGTDIRILKEGALCHYLTLMEQADQVLFRNA